MTKVSRKQLDPQTKTKITGDFWRTVAKLKNAQEAKIFLRQMLTPTEVIMLSKRLVLLKDLRRKPPYNELKERYCVTDITIAKMANILHTAQKSFLKILSRLS